MKIITPEITSAIVQTALKIGLALLILWGLSACKHQPIVLIIEPPIVVESPDSCGLKTLSFKKNIQPIVTTYCVSGVCHGGSAAVRGIDFSSHWSMSRFIKEDSTRFFGAVRHEGSFRYMPLDRPISKLDFCSIRQLETWIRQGLPDN